MEAKDITKRTSNKSQRTIFKRDVERYASMWGFGDGLFRDPPLCVYPLNEPQLIWLGVSQDDIKRTRFTYLLLLNTVKDPVARHIVVDDSRSPSIAWRALDEQFFPKTSGARMDVLDEFNN